MPGLAAANEEEPPGITDFSLALHGSVDEFPTVPANASNEFMKFYQHDSTSPPVTGRVFMNFSSTDLLNESLKDVKWEKSVEIRLFKSKSKAGAAKDVTKQLSVKYSSAKLYGKNYFRVFLDFKISRNESQLEEGYYELRVALLGSKLGRAKDSLLGSSTLKQSATFRICPVKSKVDLLNSLSQQLNYYQHLAENNGLQLRVLSIEAERERQKVLTERAEVLANWHETVDRLLKKEPDDLPYLYKRACQRYNEKDYNHALEDFSRMVILLKSEKKVRYIPAPPVRNRRSSREECLKFIQNAFIKKIRKKLAESRSGPGGKDSK